MTDNTEPTQQEQEQEQGQPQPIEPSLQDVVAQQETHAPIAKYSRTTKFAGMQAKTATEIRQHRGMFICLVGEPNAGKTTLSATIRDSRLVGGNVGKRIALFDIDGGSYVLDDHDDLDIYECKTTELLEATSQQLIRNPGEYNGVIFDNMSQAFNMYKKKHESKKNNGWAYWDAIKDDMLAITIGMRNLARNRQFFCVFVLWDTSDVEEETKRKFKDIKLSPKLAEEFLGVIDILGYVARPVKPLPAYPPILKFDYDINYPTKMRVNPRQQALTKLPLIQYQPNLGHIIDTVIGGDPWPAELHKRAQQPTKD